MPQDLIDAATRAGDSLVSSPFEVTFDRAMSFPSSGTYVLCGGQGTAQLKGFQKTLREAMERHGVRAKRGFTPHMTLMYDRARVAEHPVEPVAWWAAAFVLIRSHVGQGIYDELGRWTLSVE